MRSFILLLVLCVPMFGAEKTVTITVTEAERARIVTALRVVAALHAGTYQVRCVESSISNGRHVLVLELDLSGQKFRMRQEIPVQVVAQKERNNMIQLLGGGIWGAQYGRQVFGPLWIYAGGCWAGEDPRIWGGLGVAW